MKSQILMALRQAALLTILLAILAAPGWGQMNNEMPAPQYLTAEDDPAGGAPPPDPAMDLSVITCCGRNVQVTRGDNNIYWAVVLFVAQDGTTYYKVYKNDVDPGIASWVLHATIPTESGMDVEYDYPDIEVNSQVGIGYIFCTNDFVELREYAVREIWFSLSNQNVYDISWEEGTSTLPEYLSMTISPAGNRYYCWREANRLMFRSNTSTTAREIAINCHSMYYGNSIAYVPGNSHVVILYTNTRYWVDVTESMSAGGGGVWRNTTLWSDATGVKKYWAGGIACKYGKYIMATAHGPYGSGLDADILWRFTNSNGSWSGPNGGLDLLNTQMRPSCTASVSNPATTGFFSILYYDCTDSKVMARRTSTRNLNTWVSGMVETNNIYINCYAYSACMERGFMNFNPRYGGAWYTFPGGGNPGCWFGWAAESGADGEPFPGEELPAASTLPQEFSLLGAAPNPFNPTTTISFQLPAAERVKLAVYDLSGRLVTTLVDGQREAGTHQVTFDGSNLSSGVYLYSLTVRMYSYGTGAYSATGKMVLVK